MKGLMFLLVSVVLCVVVGSAQAGPLETLGAGLTYIQPFNQDAGGFAALSVNMRPIPTAEPDAVTLKSAPQYFLSRLTLDLLIEADDLSLGLSLPLENLYGQTEVRLGIAYAHGLMCWYVAGDLVRKEF